MLFVPCSRHQVPSITPASPLARSKEPVSRWKPSGTSTEVTYLGVSPSLFGAFLARVLTKTSPVAVARACLGYGVTGSDTGVSSPASRSAAVVLSSQSGTLGTPRPECPIWRSLDSPFALLDVAICLVCEGVRCF